MMTLSQALDALGGDALQRVCAAAGLEPPARARVSDLREALLGRLAAVPDLLPLLAGDDLERVARLAGVVRDGGALLGWEGDPSLRRRLLDRLGGPVAPRTDWTTPQVGDVVALRHRQWLVHAVEEGDAGSRDDLLVSVTNLDDDDAGLRRRLYWHREPGARVLRPADGGLGQPTHLDDPRAFAAWARALRWNAVSATEPTLFSAPFRAGLHLRDYQMVPLMRALSLPRANLFIADDVGLGKTIEAGLIVQELLRRGRVERVLVVCPAGVTRQWQAELAERFGLRFDVYTRDEVSRLRRERGLTVNPWACWPRWIVSWRTLQRPEHRATLESLLGARAERSLLVVDEAHALAPASQGGYGIDSDLTRMMRRLAPRFENRVFLSATPHNGHSNSFSALLEIVDPTRFVRATPVPGPRALGDVLIRRLKADLRDMGKGDFPTRVLLEHRLHRLGAHTVRVETVDSRHPHAPIPLATLRVDDAAERLLGALMASAPSLTTTSRDRLRFSTLQKRLLSSAWAYEKTRRASGLAQGEEEEEEKEEGPEGEGGTGRASALPVRMGSSIPVMAGDPWRPDARLLALRAWIAQHQCRAVAGDDGSVHLEGTPAAPAERGAWSDLRLIIFTEYRDTQRWIVDWLRTWCDPTDQGHRRVAFIDGTTDTAAGRLHREGSRERILERFNAPPQDDPLRILVCTDAVREGLNLQAHCHHLLHFDLPWNPSRIDQRNGRIDRHLQPSAEVFCATLAFAGRPVDDVLAALVRKTHTVRQELGAAADVLLHDLDQLLQAGILPDDLPTLRRRIDGPVDAARLEAARSDLHVEDTQLRRQREDDIRAAARAMDAAQDFVDFDPHALRAVVEVGLGMARGAPLSLCPWTDAPADLPAAWCVPDEPIPGWEATLDTLRAAPEPDEPEPAWRRRCPLRPVVFEAPRRLTREVVHLHLEHPLVQRILSRFLAQGHAALDLQRVAALRTPGSAPLTAVLACRLTLFGDTGARLHDRILTLPATVDRVGGLPEVLSGAARDRAEQRWREALRQPELPPSLRDAPAASRAMVDATPGLVRALWTPLERLARAEADRARLRLDERARTEVANLHSLLQAQRVHIEAQLSRNRELDLGTPDGAPPALLSPTEASQRRDERAALGEALRRLDEEARNEPPALAALYRVQLERVVPVALTWLVPDSW